MPSERSDDRVPERCRHGRVGAGGDQRRQLGVVERPELEHGARARAANAVAQSEHALGRRGLVVTVRPEQQDPPVVEVVREEDDQVEGGGIGPVQILEHEQHGRGSSTLGEESKRLLEDLQLRVHLRAIVLARVSQGTEGFDERLVRELHADEVDRASEEDVAPRAAGTLHELGCEPRLANARFADGEDGPSVPGASGVEQELELLDLGYAPDEHVARASIHASQYCAQTPARGCAYKHLRSEDT